MGVLERLAFVGIVFSICVEQFGRRHVAARACPYGDMGGGNEATRIDFIDGEIHINNFQHPNLVSIAMVKDAHVSNDWVTFDVPFEVAANAPELDPSGLAMGKYKIGIVISSSVDGDQFEGAVGSILDVKDLKVHH